MFSKNFSQNIPSGLGEKVDFKGKAIFYGGHFYSPPGCI